MVATLSTSPSVHDDADPGQVLAAAEVRGRIAVALRRTAEYGEVRARAVVGVRHRDLLLRPGGLAVRVGRGRQVLVRPGSWVGLNGVRQLVPRRGEAAA